MSIAAKVEAGRAGSLVLHIAARLVNGDQIVTFPGGDVERLTAIGRAVFTGANAVNGVVVIYVTTYLVDVKIAEAFDRKQVVTDILDGVRAAIKATTGQDLDLQERASGGSPGNPDNTLDRYLTGIAAVRATDPAPPWAGAAAQVLADIRAWLADAGVDLDDPKVARAVLAAVLFVDQVAREGGESAERRAAVAYDLLPKLARLLADVAIDSMATYRPRLPGDP
jgi:hypothetical protein